MTGVLFFVGNDVIYHLRTCDSAQNVEDRDLSGEECTSDNDYFEEIQSGINGEITVSEFT